MPNTHSTSQTFPPETSLKANLRNANSPQSEDTAHEEGDGQHLNHLPTRAPPCCSAPAPGAQDCTYLEGRRVYEAWLSSPRAAPSMTFTIDVNVKPAVTALGLRTPQHWTLTSLSMSELYRQLPWLLIPPVTNICFTPKICVS